MTFATRDIEWEGQKAVQLQGWSARENQFAHAVDVCIPDRDAAVLRLESLAKRGNLEPREIPENHWIDPNGRFVWRCKTATALLTVTNDKKHKAADTFTVDIQSMGGRLKVALTHAQATELADELKRLLSM